MDDAAPTAVTAGAALFVRLRALGVEVAFVNSGTDFPPIIEGLAEASAKGEPTPQTVIAPHEHVALGMAQGWHLATGATPAVMLHTNVGLANGAAGAINAATDQTPLLLLSGRTPVLERGRFGARTVPIGWGQEMRDQHALVREASKWDYELRFPEQLSELLDRGWAIANSTPKGPVYLSLPREILCQTCPADGLEAPPRMAPATTAPRPEDIARAAEILSRAKRPAIFAQRGAGSREGFAALGRLAEDWAIPVCHYWANAIAVDTDHPMAVGAAPEPWLSEADAVLAIDSLAPWAPDDHAPPDEAPVIQIAPDPLYARFPARLFRSDLSIACDAAAGVVALEEAMRPALARAAKRIAARRKRASSRIAGLRRQSRARAEGPALTKASVGARLSAALEGRRATVLSELGCPLDSMRLRGHGAWRQEPHSGGLGWSLPCAMGMRLGDPELLAVATMGDGSYIFANPTACHQVMEAYGLPVLILVLNNAEWGAVRQSVAGLYPGGYAARANSMPLTALSPSPDFVKTAEASRAWARRIETLEALDEALAQAIAVVETERRPALLDIRITG